MAPDGCENCFILIPIAPDLEDNEEIRGKYLNLVLKRIEDISGEKIVDNIIYQKSFCVKDFICLLYTSPSPRDKRQSRMPSSA